MKTKVQLKLKAIKNKVLIRFTDTTTYLLKSPNNKARLLKGLEDYERGLAKERTIQD